MASSKPNPEIQVTIRNRDSIEEVMARSFTISSDALPDIYAREHMCRPYPGGDYDFLAINVPSTFQQGVIHDGEEAPHGLLRIVTTLNNYYQVDPKYPKLNAGLLDAHRLNLLPKDVIEQVKKTRSKIIGLNPTSVNVHEAQVLAELLDLENVPYILGGIHATLDPERARNDFPNATAIVRGTGELATGPLIALILNNTEQEIPGVYWSSSDHATLQRTHDIDAGRIPLVRQDLLVEEPVYKHNVRINDKSQEIHEANLFVTYGCPFDCTFCASPIMVGRNERNGKPAYRRPDMEIILDNVEHVVNDLGATAIHFLDDMAFISPEHINELYDGLGRRELLGRFVWRGLTRAPVINRFSDETMNKMGVTGAWKIALGIESGSDEILKQIKKKVTVAQVEEAVTRLTAAGIQTKGFFIFGFPGETLDQMEETRDLIVRLGQMGMSEISAFQYKPYPGTEAFDELIRSRPEILPRLTYLRSYIRHYDQAKQGTKANMRASDTMFLPDDLVIANVSSKVVRSQVVGALEDFYGTLPSDIN